MVTLPEKPEQTPTDVEEWDDIEPHDTARPLRPHTMQAIMRRYKVLRKRGMSRKAAAFKVADDLKMKGDTIYRAILRLEPTTQLAQDYIASQAFRLAARAVRKANTSEALDILTRSNVGVLASPKGGNGDGGPQFVIGVSVDSLGAVRVGVAHGEAEEEVTVEAPSENIIDVGASFQSDTAKRLHPAAVEEPVVPAPTTFVARKKKTLLAIKAAEDRIEAKAKAKVAEKDKKDTRDSMKNAMEEIRRRAAGK